MTVFRGEELSGLMYKVPVKDLSELSKGKRRVYKMHRWEKIQQRLYETTGWAYLSKYLLYQYHVREKGAGTLAGELSDLVEDFGIKVNRDAVRRFMKKAGIPLRTLSESISGKRNPHYGVPLTKEEKSKMKEGREEYWSKRLKKEARRIAHERERRPYVLKLIKTEKREQENKLNSTS